MPSEKPKSEHRSTPRIANKKARFEYEILERVEAGLVLKGSEVKSLRAGEASLSEAFARIDGDAATLHNFQIQPYMQAGPYNHDPKRIKTLLLHKREIKRLRSKVEIKGQTLIPLAVYFNKQGKAKVELALARGKSHRDKRADQREKEDRKEMARAQRRGGY